MNLENLLYGSIPLPMNIKKCIAHCVFPRLFVLLLFIIIVIYIFISKRIFMEIFIKIRRTLNFYNLSDKDSDFRLNALKRVYPDTSSRNIIVYKVKIIFNH